MEIIPGEGVALVKIGELRRVAEDRLGVPVHPGRSRKAVYDTSPGLVVSYAEDDTVEIVEIAYSGDGGDEVFFDGVQLTFRFMDDVVADLAARGYGYEPIDIGYRFEPGFAIFSMRSRSANELDPAAAEDDGRAICEGVSVAPYEYFAAPTEEEIEAFFRDQEAACVDSPSDDPMRRYMREVTAWIQIHGTTEPGTPEDEAKRRHLDEIRERHFG
ncbi:hypothetical protein [Actinoplanes sichuanensis]|uniref:Uncharacterized protein n=1 Tax=Actinoplanes sichuanensis TaxID=512349 RepID=A0ABW4AW45_9ACTN|nr:hypothetical protein [Actinoplanes sichuanensis]